MEQIQCGNDRSGGYSGGGPSGPQTVTCLSASACGMGEFLWIKDDKETAQPAAAVKYDGKRRFLRCMRIQCMRPADVLLKGASCGNMLVCSDVSQLVIGE